MRRFGGYSLSLSAYYMFLLASYIGRCLLLPYLLSIAFLHVGAYAVPRCCLLLLFPAYLNVGTYALYTPLLRATSLSGLPQ